MQDNATVKPKQVDYCRVPRALWRCVRRWLPKPPISKRGGRPRVDDRAVLNGIWYVLWTGCQWKAIQTHWFGVSSSTLHERFQSWQRAGVFKKVMSVMVRFYGRRRGLGWQWQSIDSKTCPAPLGGNETGPSPVDRRKRGSKLHLLVDQRGAPLAILVTGANVHDKWLADDLLLSIVVPRPDRDHVEQHVCMDAGYDYPDVHAFIALEHYLAHIKRRRRRNDPPLTQLTVPGEVQFPARRWVVERTLSWLAKRRSIRTRWCKKADNWLAFLHLTCAHILFDMAVFG